MSIKLNVSSKVDNISYNMAMNGLLQMIWTTIIWISN